ncbi:hypothetical protein [Pseudoduganella lutea]|uniref:Uncharacterized protein n=1 Tax=Pseudoduganella lutea TaxID=321985 RepID=A0A4V0Z305_9BURK|nr:hypothetical protein [Pseudoduganella lutea]QBE61763.1 hypothetical protein EWM63_01080 [Pseudoduganella lutea]
MIRFWPNSAVRRSIAVAEPEKSQTVTTGYLRPKADAHVFRLGSSNVAFSELHASPQSWTPTFSRCSSAVIAKLKV